MQFGAQFVNYVCTWDDTLAAINTVQNGRWNSLWWSDHFLVPAAKPVWNKESLEGWSVVTAAAAITKELELGLLVTGNLYRNPALLTKMAVTVDQISHGRYILGIGAGWFEAEHAAYGIDFPGLKERCDRLEEALEVITRLLALAPEETANYEGTYYSLKDSPMNPPSVRQPRLPILVGGNGEKRTLKTCAKYADICNIDFNNPGGVDVFKHKMDVLNQHCEDLGRDPAEIKRTMLIPMRIEDDEARAKKELERRPWILCGKPSYIIDLIGQYIDAGVEEMMFSGVPTKAANFERIDSDVLSAFD
ncbi:MAG: TIGR03560 family F420-dependent LLM class oxidoreductase [Pseudomonadota bacterium]